MSPDLHILLVDDEQVILETYSSLLQDLGYRVATVSNACDAVHRVAEDAFDIAFVDHVLGPHRGLDLIRQMSEAAPGLYFVIMTGNGGTDLAVECLKNGASDFITKPFQVADLVKSIDYVNKKRELDRHKREVMSELKLTASRKTDELKSIYFSVLSTLAQAMEKRDLGTYGHSRRVNHCARLIAAALDLGEQDRSHLMSASLLHDIGKIGISDFILGKRGPLNKEEAALIRRHPQTGVEILKPLKQFGPILPAILHHHENYDGSGYPDGLSGEDIPFHARIIAVADTYDAILSDRPYRSAANNAAAIGELQRCAGSQFDPVVVNAFVEADAKYRGLFASA